MKKLFCFLAVASTAFFTSCSSDDNNDNGGGTPTPVESSITLTGSKTNVAIGEEVTLTVKNNLGNDVTTESTITSDNGGTVTGNKFSANAAGAYILTAKKGEFTTTLKITVTGGTNPNPTVNTIVVNGTSYDLDIAQLTYSGTQTLEDGTVLKIWRLNMYHQVGSGQSATYPSDVYFFFATEESVTLPAAANMVFGGNGLPLFFDAIMFINDAPILPYANNDGGASAQQRAALLAGFNFNLTSVGQYAPYPQDPTLMVGEIAANFGGTFTNNQTTIQGDFNSLYLYIDDSEAAAGRPSSTVSNKRTVNFDVNALNSFYSRR